LSLAVLRRLNHGRVRGTEGGQVRGVHQRRAQGQPEADLPGAGGGQRGAAGPGTAAGEHRHGVPAGGRAAGREAAQDARQRRLRLLHAGQRGRARVPGVRGPRLLRGVHQGRGAGAPAAPGRQAPGARAATEGQGRQGPGPDHAGPALHPGRATVVAGWSRQDGSGAGALPKVRGTVLFGHPRPIPAGCRRRLTLCARRIFHY